MVQKQINTVAEVKILVSCPGDVGYEKNIIKNYSSEIGKRDGITYTVIDWKNFAGTYGLREQEQ